MALPIAPTPVLTGKSAVALVRYMRESQFKRDRIVPPRVNLEEIDRLIEARREKRKENAVK